MYKVIFLNSRAPNGSVIFAESLLGKNITVQSTNITHTVPLDPEMIVVQIMSGYFKLKDSNLFGIKSPVFQFNATIIQFSNIYGEYITCRTNTRPFCLLSATSSLFTSEKMMIRNTNSAQDLFLFQSCSKVSFTSLNIYFVNMASGIKCNGCDNNQVIRKDDRQLFGLRLKSIKFISIQGSKFSNLNMSTMRVRKSNITILKTSFSTLNGLGVTYQDTPEIIEYGVDKIKFVVMESCNSSLISCFFENSLMSGQSNGGVS